MSSKGTKLQLNIIKSFFISLYRPLGLAIEVSSLCNASCTMCPREELTREKKLVDFDLFKKIIFDAKKTNVDVFQLSFYGESLMDPHLVKKIKFIYEIIPNAWVQIVTNGSLLSSDKTKELLESNISEIRISIEGNNSEEYNKIRRGLDYKEIVKNVKNLREERDRNSYKTQIIVTGLHLVNTPIDILEYERFWSQYADQVYTRNEHKLDREIKENLYSKLLPCDMLFKHLPIFSDGSYPICIYDWMGETNYDNIKNSSISQAWFAKKIMFYKIMHLIGLKRKLKLCKDCTYRTNYKKIIE